MSESAHKIGELKIPVPLPPGSTRAVDAEALPTHSALEYFVVEEWSDYTIRHPTSGVRVSKEIWARDRAAAIEILRTWGR